MSSTKVAVVTGSNKGIGFAMVKGLCEKFNGKVYLTARNESLGIEAVNKLKELGLNPVFHQLDISDQSSIDKFRDHIQNTDGGIDVLINNAAIAYKVQFPGTESGNLTCYNFFSLCFDNHDNLSKYHCVGCFSEKMLQVKDTTPFSAQAENTVAVNYFSTLCVCETIFPILRPNAQVINISSSYGHLSRIPGSEIRSKLANPKLTISELNELMNQFVNDAKQGRNEDCGWGTSAYVVSKVGLSALTIIQQKIFNNDNENRNICINSVHPGSVDTDMCSHKGVLTVEEGAKAALLLALEPHGWKGQYFWHDCTVIDWFAPDTPAIV